MFCVHMWLCQFNVNDPTADVDGNITNHHSDWHQLFSSGLDAYSLKDTCHPLGSWSPARAREIDKSQSVRQFSKWSAISGRTYGNSRSEVRIYVTFENRKRLFRGYRREFWCIYLYNTASLFTNYLSIFLDVLSVENIFKQNKNTSEFPRINSCCFRRQVHSSGPVRVQSAK